MWIDGYREEVEVVGPLPLWLDERMQQRDTKGHASERWAGRRLRPLASHTLTRFSLSPWTSMKMHNSTLAQDGWDEATREPYFSIMRELTVTARPLSGSDQAKLPVCPRSTLPRR